MTLLPSPPRPDNHHGVRHWPALHSSARALAIVTAAANDDRPWIVILPDARSLDQLHRELVFFAGDSLPVLHLPDWEVLPYDQYSPLPDLISGRLATLARLPGLQRGVVLASAESMMQRLPPTDFIEGRSFDISVGQQFSIPAASAQLARAGYSAVAQVGVPGEFALRGSLFDVFPMGYAQALRIDLFDDRIDSIRHFDPDTQRSLDRLERLRLLPAREFPLDEESCREFRRRFRNRFEGDPSRSAIYRGVRQNIVPPGAEFYLPLFFERTATLFQYLPARRVIVTLGETRAGFSRVWDEVVARHEDRRHDIEHPLLDPLELFQSPEECWRSCRNPPAWRSRHSPPSGHLNWLRRLRWYLTHARQNLWHHWRPCLPLSAAAPCWPRTRPAAGKYCRTCCATQGLPAKQCPAGRDFSSRMNRFASR